MDRSSDTHKSQIVKAIVERFKQSEDIAASHFAEYYLETFSPEDITSLDIDDLFSMVLSQWKFIYTRKPLERKVRVQNPRRKTFTHTIIEVCCADMPFLVDSIRMEINRLGYLVHFIAHLGGIHLVRNQKNQVEQVISPNCFSDDAKPEAVIHIEIDRQTDKAVMQKIVDSLKQILNNVCFAVTDWQVMREQLKQAIADIDNDQLERDPAEVAESKDFLRWIDSDHFTFLGYQEYEYKHKNGQQQVIIKPGSSLGVFREVNDNKNKTTQFSDLPKVAQEKVLSKELLIIAKANIRSTVHRAAYADYIGVKIFNNKFEPIGERAFIGLYTSVAYNSNPKHIPFLRHKVARIMRLSNLTSHGHASKSLLNIIEQLPRDDLFQAPEQELLSIAMGILHLQERQRTRLFIRKDVYGRYFSCLVYIPKDRVNTGLRIRLQHILEGELQGHDASFTTNFSDSVLAHIHFVLRVDPKVPHKYNVKSIEKRLIKEVRSWVDHLRDKLIDVYGEADGIFYYNKYKNAFPEGYKEQYNAHTAARDIYHMETICENHPLDMSFYRSVYKGRQVLRFKLFNHAHTMPLSDVLPLLENLGLRVLGERPNEIIISDKESVWINDFDLIYEDTDQLDVDAIKPIFQEAFSCIWQGLCESDNFNRLVLKASLTWREVNILRAYTRYLHQLGFTFSQSYIEETFVEHANIAKKIIQLFEIRFDPEVKTRNIERFTKKIEALFDEVSNLDQDRILHRYIDLVNATLRTNFYQTNAKDQPKPYLSLKMAPELIPDIPSPVPMYEIFVFSTRVVGVHLRMSKVARGGLRWSDRREDYRTEVLGLMKAQQVKNAVIVPMGAKGGFYPKQLMHCKTREAYIEEGISSYKLFISGLLDVVDNMISGQVQHPEKTICYDGDDAYLVVAADKGTAAFSDIANSISKEYGYWLSDAFASGGSTGYDHKKMAITARGAWESVKRSFRELLNLNPQKEVFTAIGVGDMAGDVFGNGMLQSKKMKLVAAFNHMHIFIDPDPDPETSYQERARLFKLKRSTWADYDASVISSGGGVFSRFEKSIVLSEEIKALLDIKKESVNPQELMKAVLQADVDLLWNGGVGTFVKAADELHADAGDKQNDPIRVNANELKVKIVGEGGNLGFTQLARIEYARNGGKIYTDFVDNSAGVDCSDHEVNIKILLDLAISNHKLNEVERNQLLSKMSNEVAKLVLKNNYMQTEAISFSVSRSHIMIDAYRRMINEWDKKGKLDRTLMFLPGNKELQERRVNGLGLLKPEIAVLLSHSKIALKKDLLESGVPEDSDFNEFLHSAFPVVLQEQYKEEMLHHSLRREIIATQVSNYVSNRMGINFVGRMAKETGCSAADAVRAFICVVKVFDLGSLWQGIEKLDYRVSADVQLEMFEKIYLLARRSTRWFIKNHRKGINIKIIVKHFKAPIDDIKSYLPECLTDNDKNNYKSTVKYLVSKKVPKEFSTKIALCSVLFSALDIVEASKIDRYSHKILTRVYYQLSEQLSLGWLRQQVISQPIESQWDERIRFSLLDDIDWQQRRLSVNILGLEPRREELHQQLLAWFTLYEDLISRWNHLISELKASNISGFTMFSVALRALLEFAQASK